MRLSAPAETPRRIVFTGDLLRPVDQGFRPSQSDNIAWFARLVGRAVRRASAVEATTVAWGEGFDTAQAYAIAGVPQDIAGWAALFDATALPGELLGLLHRTFEGSLVIGFELATSLKRALTFLGIAWIDANIHPVRFLPDVFFAMQTNHAGVFEALLRHHVPPSVFEPWADLLMATSVKIPLAEPLTEKHLVVGQTPSDRSLVRRGRLHDLADFTPRMMALSARGQPILFKPHPYALDDFGLFRGGLPFRRARITRANVYRLMCEESLRTVVAVSSSVAVEAPFFGKQVEWLLGSPFDLVGQSATARHGQHVSVVEGLMSADFWREVLAPLMPVTSPDGFRPVLPPHSLRISLQNFWGFNEMSTDFLVRAYQGAR